MTASPAAWRTVSIGLLAVGAIGLAALKWAKNIRDLLGIRKDALETKKTKLELKRMESTIVAPTDAEVVAYDPKRKAIIKAAKERVDLIEIGLILLILLLGGVGGVLGSPSIGHRIQEFFEFLLNLLK